MKNPNWGGQRKNAGHPKGDYPQQTIKVACTTEEKKLIEATLTTRQRAERMKEMANPTNNQELREMAQAALNNWDFDEETDPDGDIKAGLEYYASGGDAVPDEDVPGLFRGYKRQDDKWDILEEIARGVGSQRLVCRRYPGK